MKNVKNEIFFSPRGWIANEIFRRVHPEGSTIGRSKKLYFLPFKIWSIPGEFLRSKVSEPLNARAFVGVREEELADYEPGREIGLGFLFGNSLIPKALGSGVDLNFLELCALFNNFRKMMGKHKSPFVELDLNQGAGAFYNQARGTETIRDGVALHHKTLDS